MISRGLEVCSLNTLFGQWFVTLKLVSRLAGTGVRDFMLVKKVRKPDLVGISQPEFEIRWNRFHTQKYQVRSAAHQSDKITQVVYYRYPGIHIMSRQNS